MENRFLHVGDGERFISIGLDKIVFVEKRGSVFRVKTTTGDVVQVSHSAENAAEMYACFVDLLGTTDGKIEAPPGASIGFASTARQTETDTPEAP